MTKSNNSKSLKWQLQLLVQFNAKWFVNGVWISQNNIAEVHRKSAMQPYDRPFAQLFTFVAPFEHNEL